MTKQLYIIRHGQTDYNKQHIVQGSGVNSSLNETGRQQARAFYKAYKHIPFDAIFTSSLVRTHQTVAPFLDKNIHWQQFDDINEISWGDHEGKSPSPEMKQEFASVTQAWSNGDFHARVKGGESAWQVKNRLEQFINFVYNYDAEQLLICSHGRTMRCLICLLEGRPISNMEDYHHSNTGLYQVHQHSQGFEVMRYNDKAHKVLIV